MRRWLELELRNRGPAQRLDDGFEQVDGLEAGGRGARDATGRHDGRLPHDDHQAAADAQLVFQGVGHRGHRAGDQDGVVFGGAPAVAAVAGFDLDVGDVVHLQVLLRERHQAVVDFYRGDLLRQVRQQRGLVARARADFQHAVGGGELQFLGQASFDLGRQHDLAGIDRVDLQRDFQVGKGQGAQRRRHELLAAHREQGVKHLGVEHIPGADLLLNHVEAGFFYVGQGRSVHDGKGKIRKNQRHIVLIRRLSGRPAPPEPGGSYHQPWK
ncbi:hypothetical protein predicted by Glimmer/Critica [Bordetella petrii]|uniref:Uncharacterized protein n=1 Tax=Bordetella petrii (strain ATCC BAA-461 / DSM 12804 / CCUG 43448 / CIP 107267 / Se-1111R) TaxID=340100 RepID=A9I134_BORPD|nr:hypothetical protein predicted by Glimmer/Critica [Bordetella petrii]